MDTKQKSQAYALAKILGYDKSAKEFFTEYSQYYDEAYKQLQSELPKNEAYAVNYPNPSTGAF